MDVYICFIIYRNVINVLLFRIGVVKCFIMGLWCTNSKLVRY